MHVAVPFNILSAKYFLLENLAECSASHARVHLILIIWYLNKRLDFPRKFFFPLSFFLQSILFSCLFFYVLSANKKNEATRDISGIPFSVSLPHHYVSAKGFYNLRLSPT